MAREYAFRFLFHLQFDGLREKMHDLQHLSDPEGLLEIHLEEFDAVLAHDDKDKDWPVLQIDEKGKLFARDLILSVIRNESKAKELVTSALSSWKIENLHRIDLVVLMMAATEMLITKNAPFKVVISESLKLVERYGMNDSAGFVNGVLDQLAKINKLK